MEVYAPLHHDGRYPRAPGARASLKAAQCRASLSQMPVLNLKLSRHGHVTHDYQLESLRDVKAHGTRVTAR